MQIISNKNRIYCGCVNALHESESCRHCQEESWCQKSLQNHLETYFIFLLVSSVPKCFWLLLSAWLVAAMLWFAGTIFNFSSCKHLADFEPSALLVGRPSCLKLGVHSWPYLKARRRHSWKCDFKCAMSLCLGMWQQCCRNPWMHMFCLCSGVSDTECWSSAHTKIIWTL